MIEAAYPALVLVAVSLSPSAAPRMDVQAGSVRPSEVRLLELASVRRLVHTIAQRGEAKNEAGRAEALADVVVLTGAVVGGPLPGAFTIDDLVRAAATRRGPRVMARPGVTRRDEAAYRLLAVGYSARETADVVSGRISRRALDAARRMIAAGGGREAAGDYLDAQYRLARAAAPPGRMPSRDDRPRLSTVWDGLIDRYARLHSVDAGLVRAIMHTESAFNATARSPAGAIGLMQLMPSTARELGVDPFVPEQNIEGGVRYFSHLLRMFGGVELALVAYNAGPGFARRYANGEAALYGETRDYVRQVLSRFRGP